MNDDQKWFRVSLRLAGETLDPHRVEELLGLETSTLGIKGCARLGKNGRRYAPYETNLWVHKQNLGSDVCFNEQIEALFEALADRTEELRKLCHTEGIEGELFCGFSSRNGQGGDSISPGNLRRVAEAGLFLTLDLYPPCLDSGD